MSNLTKWINHRWKNVFNFFSCSAQIDLFCAVCYYRYYKTFLIEFKIFTTYQILSVDGPACIVVSAILGTIRMHVRTTSSAPAWCRFNGVPMVISSYDVRLFGITFEKVHKTAATRTRHNLYIQFLIIVTKWTRIIYILYYNVIPNLREQII